MLFRKKKEMIDIRKLHKGGVVRLPAKDIVIPQNKDGFIEMGASSKPSTSTVSMGSSGVSKSSGSSDMFDFMDLGSSSDSSSSSFSTQKDGYSKREVDAKITSLDNKVYKLEQRIELLEKKVGVNQSSDDTVGPMGW